MWRSVMIRFFRLAVEAPHAGLASSIVSTVLAFPPLTWLAACPPTPSGGPPPRAKSAAESLEDRYRRVNEKARDLLATWQGKDRQAAAKRADELQKLLDDVLTLRPKGAVSEGRMATRPGT